MYQRVIEEYYSMIEIYCSSKLNGNHKIADEITQEVFLTLYKKLHRIKKNIKSRLYRIADKKIKKYLKENPSLNDSDIYDYCEEKSIEMLNQKISDYDFKRNKPLNKFFRKVMPFICILTLVVSLNYKLFYKVFFKYKLDLVSFVEDVRQWGWYATVDVELKVDVIPTSEDDPFGMIMESARHNIYPDVPYYLPEGFKLYSTSYDEVGSTTSVYFVFQKGNKSVFFEFTRYWEGLLSFNIPSDEHNFSERTVNGKPAIVSMEDHQYVIGYYSSNNTLFYMFTQDVPYDECEKIVDSIENQGG